MRGGEKKGNFSLLLKRALMEQLIKFEGLWGDHSIKVNFLITKYKKSPYILRNINLSVRHKGTTYLQCTLKH